MKEGFISWFAKNHVAANLLMISIIFIGVLSLNTRIPLEVFPSIELDVVNIRTSLPGSTPSETEQGITIRVEESVSDLEGIDNISSRSSEGSSSVTVELSSGYDAQVLLNEIKNRVDAINTLPVDAEKPLVSKATRKREVISVVVYGDVSEKELRQVSEQVRDDIISIDGITQVFLENVRPFEIAIEVNQDTLREYGITIDQITNAIKNNSLDLSAGNIKTTGGDVLLRTQGQAYEQAQFENLIIRNRADGSLLRLSDIATISDGFEEQAILNRFNGERAMEIEVYSVGQQSAIEVADKVKAYLAEKSASLPQSIKLDYWRDRSQIVKNRLSTLINSAIQGGVLVLLLLTLFLRPKVAFWVVIGIPVSFMGALSLLPVFGITINIVSLFAFILVLGIVVDDAIVTGENIHTHMERHGDGLRAAIEGTQEVATPVTFGILTTVAAFIPLALIEGGRSVFFKQLPFVVIPVLLFSLIESKFVLPAHLKYMKKSTKAPGAFSRFQKKFANGLEHFIAKYYQPVLVKALKNRLLTLSLFLSVVAMVYAMVFSGWTRFIFFPRVPSEIARASLVMPIGTPFETTDKYVSLITDKAQQLQEKYIDEATGESLIVSIMSSSGSAGGSGSGQSHVGRVMFQVVAPEKRESEITSGQLVNEWRQMIGPIPGAEEVNYRAEIGRSSNPIDIRLSGQDLNELQSLAEQVKVQLAQYPDVFDITDSMSNGKSQIELELKPQGEVLGITLSSLARQVRQAFFGAQVQRIQRGRDDIRVMLRYSLAERSTVNTLENLIITSPDGVQVPFNEVGVMISGKSPSVINRLDRKRTLNVTADVNKESINMAAVNEEMSQFLNQLTGPLAGVGYEFGGEAEEQRESFGTLFYGLIAVLFVIYALLAIPFKSYAQPMIVMSIIPFSPAGAIIGHWIMGMDLTILSMMGMLALTGVVVNDSLVLVDYVNKKREEGKSLLDAVTTAGMARFRPVILTSLTTFVGLMPLIFEKSTQAQFLIPMAVSLGFGIMFATFMTLFLIPVNYLLLEDARRGVKKMTGADSRVAKV
ncbi:efflux RND transporter permease subunit [Marinicella rhabdoformis]|uniref:efflux RND transporter permease subunit n=1 Tax=Marinicella rhabdoformis TaxID=2580566 RepID=UPI0012AED960|nr:efflux RND transporter permease subunit [Marinicella rhabdoformis]